MEQVFLGRNSITDHYALLAAERIARSLPRAVKDGGDKEARADMSYGSMLAGLAFSHAGNGAPHALQYPIGAATHTPTAWASGCCCPTRWTRPRTPSATGWPPSPGCAGST